MGNYEEALARAKQGLSMDDVFPELKESEDERIRMALIKLMTTAGENYVMSATGFKKERLLAYLEKQKEQKPAEWSEEDERKLNRIYEILGYAADDKGFLLSKRIIGDKEAVELQEYLKSLRPSWKPSEQEKGALRTAIYVLTDERKFPKAAAHLQNILDVFEGEGARKDWKPSEEQMSMLRAIVNDPNNVGAESCHLAMQSLYNDLKAL